MQDDDLLDWIKRKSKKENLILQNTIEREKEQVKQPSKDEMK